VSRTADETTIVRTEVGMLQDMKLAMLQAETNDPTSTSDHGSKVTGDKHAPTRRRRRPVRTPADETSHLQHLTAAREVNKTKQRAEHAAMMEQRAAEAKVTESMAAMDRATEVTRRAAEAKATKA
jgi:hypothetical protein